MSHDSTPPLWRVKHPFHIEVRTHRDGPLVGVVEVFGELHRAHHLPSNVTVTATTRLRALEVLERLHDEYQARPPYPLAEAAGEDDLYAVARDPGFARNVDAAAHEAHDARVRSQLDSVARGHSGSVPAASLAARRAEGLVAPAAGYTLDDFSMYELTDAGRARLEAEPSGQTAGRAARCPRCGARGTGRQLDLQPAPEPFGGPVCWRCASELGQTTTPEGIERHPATASGYCAGCRYDPSWPNHHPCSEPGCGCPCRRGEGAR